MKIHNSPLIILSSILFSVPASAGQINGDAAFFKALSGIRRAAPQVNFHIPAASPASRETAGLSAADQLDDWLGLFGRLELQPELGLDEITAEVTGGLRSGLYDGLIMGESHGIQPEIDAGIVITKAVLKAKGIGAFSRESNLFPDTGFLEEKGVPVLTFKNQFKPGPDVQAGFQAAGEGLLATYTGHVHTSRLLKDYFLYTLLEGKPFGYGVNGKDMVTVEDSFLTAGKRPVIVGMVTEARVLNRIEQLFLRRSITADGVDASDYLAGLRAMRSAWEKRVMAYPRHDRDIYFVRSPGQPNLFVGITPCDRRPLAAEAVLEVLAGDDFKAWIGAEKMKYVESLWSSDETGIHYRVVARKFSGETFERTVTPPPAKR